MATKTPSPYKPDLEATFARRVAFCRREEPAAILAIFGVVGCGGTYHLRGIPDRRKMLAYNLERMRLQAEIDDDAVPLAQTHLGMGLFSAIFGSEIAWQPEEETSWSGPPFSAWPRDLERRLAFDLDNPYIELARSTIAYYVEQSKAQFGVGLLETVDALNFVVALRGATNSYLDLYEHPREVEQAMELGLEWNTRWLEMQWREAGPFGGGWCSLGDWLPEKTVWLSVDAYSCCHPSAYVERGQQYMQRLVDHFGLGWQHLHGNSVYLLPEIVKLRGLVAVQIGEDPGYPRPFDILRDLRRQSGDIPLQIGCTWQEFTRGLEEGSLTGGVEYHVSGAPSVEAANECAAHARQYRDRALKPC